MHADINLLGGENTFLLLKHIFGMDFKSNLNSVRYLAGLWELLAKDPFSMY